MLAYRTAPSQRAGGGLNMPLSTLASTLFGEASLQHSLGYHRAICRRWRASNNSRSALLSRPPQSWHGRSHGMSLAADERFVDQRAIQASLFTERASELSLLRALVEEL